MKPMTAPLGPERSASPPQRYDTLAQTYDDTRRADPILTAALRAQLQVVPTGRYIDVGCGTGNYLAALRDGGRIDVVGLDVSHPMLDVASRKAFGAHLIHAGATAIPVDDGAFDGAVSCLAVHHFPDLEAACLEVARVVRDRYVIFTTDPAQADTFWLNEYFPGVMESGRLLMPPVIRLATALRRAGFAKVEVSTWDIPHGFTDYFLYGAKHQPERYLEPAVRNGITRFRHPGHDTEVARGCRRLADDIRTGRFHEVRAAHPSICGDYSFVVASK